MLMRRSFYRAALILCALILPTPTVANCDAVHTLAAIHDNYRAILQETGTNRARAAARLYPLLANTDLSELAVNLKTEIEQDRWIDTLNSAENLAKDVISGLQLSQAGQAPHTNQVDWIAGIVRKSPCFKILGNTGFGTAGQTGWSQSPMSPQANKTPRKQKPANPSTPFPLRTFTLVFLSVLSLGLILRIILRSRQVRAHLVSRLPRKSVQIEFDIHHKDNAGLDVKQRVKALDISTGGMKLKVETSISQGTPLNLELALGDWTASVVWANAHYAGIMFDRMLSDAELTRLTNPQENSP